MTEPNYDIEYYDALGNKHKTENPNAEIVDSTEVRTQLNTCNAEFYTMEDLKCQAHKKN